jgi:DNA-binding transcriptional MerR regulator
MTTLIREQRPGKQRTEEPPDLASRSWHSIQQVAVATGLSTHTLRYYEKAGLLTPVQRSEGGTRRYNDRDIDSLLFITRLRLTGMPIQKIRTYVELRTQGPSTNGDRRKLLEEHRLAVLGQITELRQCLAAVEFKIDLYQRGWVPQESNDPCLDELRKLCTPRTEKEVNV